MTDQIDPVKTLKSRTHPPEPSVTEVLRPWAQWNRLPHHVVQYAAARGTRVHELIAEAAQANMLGLPHSPPNLDDRPLWGYVDSWTQWYHDQVDQVICVERQYHDLELGYHGRPDMIVVLRGDGDQQTVVDIKTAKQTHHTWPYQLAAYVHLAEHNGHPPISKALVARVRQDRRQAAITVWTRPKLAEYFEIFRCALVAHQHLAKG